MDTFEIAGHSIRKGESKQIHVPVASLYTDTEISMPVHIIRGRKAGPTLFLSAAIHGDELNGIEIIQRIINRKNVKNIQGTLIAVPMVNVYGVLNQSRYMPDRRDLNRSFPGSVKGSMAGRFANLFLNEIVQRCDYGIDLHTGAIHRSNLPQIRGNLEDPETLELAKAFNVPVLVHSNLRDGSLRQAAVEHGVKILLYEAGEALRFDELSIRAGVRGILKVMSHLGMIKSKAKSSVIDPFIAQSSSWVRAPASGIIRNRRLLGDKVQPGDILCTVLDPFGNEIDNLKTTKNGVIIGKQEIPLAQEGDALYHIAYFDKPEDVADLVESMQDHLLTNNLPTPD